MIDLQSRNLPRMNTSLIVGAAALALAMVGGLISRDGAFYRAYLFAYVFWLSISLGSLGLLMMYHLTGGNWGRLSSRIFEAASLTLPLMLVLFIPIAIGVRHLYPWANPAELAADPVLQHKHAFFNIPVFLLRSFVFLALWSLLAIWLRNLSVARDRDPLPHYGTRFSAISSAGLVFYFFSMSAASIDWIMSRQPHWYSSVFGIVIVVAQGLSGTLFTIVILWALRQEEPIAAAMEPHTLNDLGNLLLMFVVFWAYVSFAQLLVTWMGNTQEENIWYYQRVQGIWKFVSIALIALHFFVPFLLLLGQELKRRIAILGTLALCLLAMRLIDAAYLVLPTSATGQPMHLSWIDLLTPIGIGGLWMAGFRWNLQRQPLLVRVPEPTTTEPTHGNRHDIATA